MSTLGQIYDIPPLGKRIPTLDGWRGIAILLVLAEHYCKFAAWHLPLDHLGQHGVGIFFVLSGFLITSNLLLEQEASGTVSLRAFYRRRFLRLGPTAIAYLIAVVILASAIHDVPACLLFYRNYSYGSVFTGHFWSLSLEEQFYLFWPATLVLFRPSRALWIALGGAVAVGIWRFHNLPVMMAENFQATTRTEYRADALLLGCALAILMRYARPRKLISGFPLIPALFVLSGCICHYRLHFMPFWESVLVALLLGSSSLLGADHPVRRALDWRPLASLGRISYSVYVWQQILTYSPARGLKYTLMFLIGTPALSLGSYYFIEQRFRSRRKTSTMADSAKDTQSESVPSWVSGGDVAKTVEASEA